MNLNKVGGCRSSFHPIDVMVTTMFETYCENRLKRLAGNCKEQCTPRLIVKGIGIYREPPKIFTIDVFIEGNINFLQSREILNYKDDTEIDTVRGPITIAPNLYQTIDELIECLIARRSTR